LGVCKFSTVEQPVLTQEDLAVAVSEMLDRDLTGQDLLGVGERIVNLERLYNVRQGLGRADDALPARFTQEPLPLYDVTLDEEGTQTATAREPVRTGLVREWDAMLDRYYALRGWDDEGRPTRATLRRLHLMDLLQGQTLGLKEAAERAEIAPS
jgi:aldehyde:ferredoxin oxidoreductase